MILPDDFQFSASSLQDIIDCPRRFYLRYVRQLRYPAAEAEPLRAFEQHVEHALRFHQLVHQHQVGIPADALEASIADETVGAWWKSYLAHAPADLPPSRFSEIALSVPLLWGVDALWKRLRPRDSGSGSSHPPPQQARRAATHGEPQEG